MGLLLLSSSGGVTISNAWLNSGTDIAGSWASSYTCINCSLNSGSDIAATYESSFTSPSVNNILESASSLGGNFLGEGGQSIVGETGILTANSIGVIRKRD